MNAPHQSARNGRRSPTRRRLHHRGIGVALAGVCAVATAAAIVAPAQAGQGSSNHAKQVSKNGWNLQWVDNFSGSWGKQPSTDEWTYDTGHHYAPIADGQKAGPENWGTGEIEEYTASIANLHFDGHGHLEIVATQDDSGRWYSSRIETLNNWKPAKGHALKFEARIKLPAGGPGYWSAFWALGANYRGNYWNWPGIGEIDILENIGSEPTVTHGTLHCGVYTGSVPWPGTEGPCHETNGIGSAYVSPDGTPFTAGYHDYSVIWDNSTPVQELRWYVDGHLYQTVKQTDLPADTWKDMTDHGYFLLLNLAIGGGWPGNPVPGVTVSGEAMSVDYVAVWQSKGKLR